MTLVIGIANKREHSLLISSDSKASKGETFELVRKVRTIEVENKKIVLCIFGGAGDASLLERAYSISSDIFNGHFSQAVESNDEVDSNFLSQRNFAQIIDEINCKMQEETQISSERITLKHKYREGYHDPTNWRFIIGGLTSDKQLPQLYLLSAYAEPLPRHDDPGFAAIGNGSAGAEILMSMLGVSQKRLERWDPDILCSFLIDTVSTVYQGVSNFLDPNNSLLMTRTSDGEIRCGPLKKKGLVSVKNELKKRLSLIQTMWDLCESEFGTSTKIERLLNQLKKARNDGNFSK